MIKYKKVFICDECGHELETDFSFSRRIDKPDGWEPRPGGTLLCADCLSKLHPEQQETKTNP